MGVAWQLPGQTQVLVHGNGIVLAASKVYCAGCAPFLRRAEYVASTYIYRRDLGFGGASGQPRQEVQITAIEAVMQKK